MKTPSPRPLYERFTVYPASGTVLQSFYCGGATLREAQVSHPLAQVDADEDSRVELPRDISSARRPRSRFTAALAASKGSEMGRRAAPLRAEMRNMTDPTKTPFSLFVVPRDVLTPVLCEEVAKAHRDTGISVPVLEVAALVAAATIVKARADMEANGVITITHVPDREAALQWALDLFSSGIDFDAEGDVGLEEVTRAVEIMEGYLADKVSPPGATH